MSVEITLKRNERTPWGFRLIGGTDFEIPLTVVKVQRDSIAECNGLCNSDILLSINGRPAHSMSHDEAHDAIVRAGHNLQLVICRGPFDQGTGFETTTSAHDTDHTFQPSEVENRPVSPFVPQTKPYRPFSTEPVPNVPPVEDPIILNPNYNDKFPKCVFKEKIETIFKLPISPQYKGDPDEDLNDVAEKQIGVYSSNISTTNESIAETKVLMTKEEVEFDLKMKDELDLFEIEQTASLVVNESIEAAVNVAEEIKQEIDIELTDIASSKEVTSIDKTIESIASTKSIKEHVEHQETSKIESTEFQKQERITENITQQESQENKLNISESDCKSETIKTIDVKNTEHKETSNKDQVTASHVTSSNIESNEESESSQNNTLENKSEHNITMIGNDNQSSAEYAVKDNSKYIQRNEEDKEYMSSKSDSRKMVEDQEELQTFHGTTTKVTKSEHKTAYKTESSKHRIIEGIKATTSQGKTTKRSSAEQRAFELGLQTIPSIRAKVKIGNPYDMLLRTFFFHLTDVMVVLSKFITLDKGSLSPSNSTENLTQVQESTEVVHTKDMIVNNSKSVKEQNNNLKINEESSDKTARKNSMRQAIKKHAKDVKKAEEAISEQIITSTKADNKATETTQSVNQESKKSIEDTSNQVCQANERAVEVRERKSGSKMAQLTEKRSEELIHNMDAVVSEFQTKTESLEINETDESTAIINGRRSTSKSRIEEEVSRESDPLEWLSKRNESTESISSQNIKHRTEIKKSIIKSTVQEQAEKLVETSETASNAKTYIAIVEAHVYTNKDLIGEVNETSEEIIKENRHDVTSSLENVISENESGEKKIAQVYEQKQELQELSKHTEINDNIKLDEKEDSIVIDKSEVVAQAEVSIQQTKIEMGSQNINITSGKIQHETLLKEEISLVNDVTSKTVEAISDHTETIQEKSSVQISEVKEEEADSISLAKTIIKEFIENEQQTKMLQINHENMLNVNVISAQTIVQNEIVNQETTSNFNKNVEIQELVEGKIETYKLGEESLSNSSQEILEVVESCEGEILQEVIKDEEITLEEAMKKSNIAIITCEPIKLETKTLEKTETYESEQKEKTEAYASELKEQTVTFETESSKQEKTVKFETEVRQHNLEEVEEMAAIFERGNPSKLSLKLNKSKEFGDLSKTPTPSTVPPTPLTDEYVFRLELPLVESKNPIKELTPPSESSEHEDPNIVKKRLIPHIETEIEQLVYDHPLPSPAINLAPAFPPHAEGTLKEEILDIERKSSLLASAIDETIRSIEEYKEQAGIEYETNKTTTLNDNITRTNIEEFDVINNNIKSKAKMNTENIERRNNEEITINNTSLLQNSIMKNEETMTSNMKMQSSTKTDELINEFNIDNIEKMASYNNILKDSDQLLNTQNINNYQINNEVAINNTQTENKELLKFENNAAEITHFESKSIEQDWAKVAQQVTTNTENLAKLTQIKVAEENNGIVGDDPGTNEGIMNTMEGSTVIDAQIAKEIGKPGLSDDKIAELISGEAEMLREAHVMGLKRVIASHMTRPSDSSVDFKKIKPIIENLKDSQVLKALNEEVMKTHEEKKKEERKWTTFLQKPKRPVPQNKLGYLFRYTQPEEENSEDSYKVKIVKQPKPKVAPDYKPEDFETGPLPWEERAANEPPPPPIPREDPILVPEGVPEYIEAVDPLPESEVPDLEDSGIPLPKEKVLPQLPLEEVQPVPEEPKEVVAEVEEKVEEVEECKKEENSENKMADELLGSIQNMVDPNATLEQQLNQMRSQLAALAQLPGVIQQTLDLVTKQLTCLNTQEICQTVSTQETSTVSTEIVEAQEQSIATVESVDNQDTTVQITDVTAEMESHEAEVEIVSEAIQKLKADEAMMLEEQQKVEKEKKLEYWNKIWPWGNRKSYCRIYRINFMKYEKPPVSLDHLKDSDVYKLVHSLDDGPTRRVEMLTPVIAECDYREKCRSVTPCSNRGPQDNQTDYSQQLQP